MYKTVHSVVFEEKPGGGNPAPVTLDADELSAEEMQAMTFRFGEESVFLMKPTRGDCDVKARYFVPLHEMEMCSHDTIGAVTVLVKTGRVTKSPVRLETALGQVLVVGRYPGLLQLVHLVPEKVERIFVGIDIRKRGDFAAHARKRLPCRGVLL